MTAVAHWTPEALSDLDEIVYWIAIEDERPEIAFRIADELREKADEFAKLPRKGQRHPDIAADWYYFRHKRWLVFYRVVEDGIDVVRVIDVARDFKEALGYN